MKNKLIKIVISSILLIISLVIKFEPKYINLALYIISYLIVRFRNTN